MKVVIATLILTLVTYVPKDKSLKSILKDGQFSRLPKTAKIIGHEVVLDKQKRFGYLAFQAPSQDIVAWITKSKLVWTHKEEIFNKDIIVRSTDIPKWYKDSSKKLVKSELGFFDSGQLVDRKLTTDKK